MNWTEITRLTGQMVILATISNTRSSCILRNVITNLTTHSRKRLLEFLKLLVWEQNVNNEVPNDVLDAYDAENAMNRTVERYDTTRGDVDRLNGSAAGAAATH